MATLIKEGDDPARYSVDEPNTQSSTIRFGEYLIVHIMSTAVSKRFFRRWRHPSAIAPALLQIWPYKDAVISWPPTHKLTDAQIVFLADDMFNRILRKTQREAGLLPALSPRH